MLWALVPFLSYGFGTPFSFGYAALRRRSAGLGVAAGGYGLGTVGAIALMSVGHPGAIFLALLLMTFLCVTGTVHSFVVRGSVFPREQSGNWRNKQAIGVAKYRMMLRQEARTLVRDDPALAHELRIGRPDLPRGYDDGGLIDVNHAPAATLAMLPGLTPELVERIVQKRTEQGGFVSVEELALDADLPPELVQRLGEYAIFLP
ncbi:helix-hairpin-helix domain-containing protein [Actinomadura craniellae]|uniref:Helix-hairpin-helix domain-containing protein n=1 Tax=Actinomadura craniellae TaxID=2231787 RepID=A0A365H7Y9_9ACTN|nr:helix-hairpin-helix domain-containing protein [Actinomadura craniellae]